MAKQVWVCFINIIFFIPHPLSAETNRKYDGFLFFTGSPLGIEKKYLHSYTLGSPPHLHQQFGDNNSTFYGLKSRKRHLAAILEIDGSQ